MQDYDIIFLHAPKTFKSFKGNNLLDRINKNIEKKEDPMFCFMPMGIFALASILYDKGYKVKIINLGVEQHIDKSFDIYKYIKTIRSKIYAIDLQWVVHSSSSLQLAKICKEAHPDSYVVLGGMTATWFKSSIMKNNNYVDAILLGEADASITCLVEAMLNEKSYDKVDGIIYRLKNTIKENPIRNIPSSLDNINFTNLTLLDNYDKYVYNDIMECGKSKQKIFWLSICRGCIYNCIYCGGSNESYKIFSKRESIIMRSPIKIAMDIEKLESYGIEYVNFSHDPRIGGKKYLSQLIDEIRKRKIDISAYIETFTLPNKKFINDISKTFDKTVIALSPESAHENVRNITGRYFSNKELFKSISQLKKKKIETHLYFTMGLPGEKIDNNTFNYYKKFIETIFSLGGIVIPSSVYTIDPNCIMAVKNKKYGIRLLLKSFTDYQNICHSRNPIDWIGHETKLLTKNNILNLTMMVQELALNSLFARARAQHTVPFE